MHVCVRFTGHPLSSFLEVTIILQFEKKKDFCSAKTKNENFNCFMLLLLDFNLLLVFILNRRSFSSYTHLCGVIITSYAETFMNALLNCELTALQ